MSKVEPTDAARLVQRIDNALDSLREDRSEVVSILPSHADAFDEALAHLRADFTRQLKNLAIDPELESVKGLERLYEELVFTRERLLSQAAEIATEQLERKVRNPLWIGERASHIAELQRIRGSLRKQNAEGRQDSIRALKTEISKLGSIRDRINLDEGRARIRIPLQMILWGLPIVIGVWISGRLSTIQNFLILLLVAAAALVSYVTLRFSLFNRISLFKRFRKRNRSLLPRRFILFQIPILMLAMLVPLSGVIDKYIVGQRMRIDMEEKVRIITRETNVEVPFNLSYNHGTPALSVMTRVEAPGLSVNERVLEFNAVSSQTRRGVFALEAPNDLPSGEYSLEIEISFSSRAWLPWIQRLSRYYRTHRATILVE